MIQRKKIFGVGIFLFLVGFVLAVIAAPTAMLFTNNVTSVYDEGNFTINWSAGGSDEVDYTVYIFADNVLYTTPNNDSIRGYSFNNHTEANYTFIIEAVNDSGDKLNSTSNVSLYVDRTAPVITLPVYTNATLKNSSETLTLNISVIDANSGETGSMCLIDVNGTNQSIAVSSEWCNSTSISLTGASNGNQTISVYVNDTVNILGLNNSYVAQIDSTAPSPSGLTLSSASMTSLTITFSGAEGTCTASGSGTKSISGSTLTVTGLSCDGSYAYTITCTDGTGNSGTSSSTTFSTSACGGNTDQGFWTTTFKANKEQFANGYTQKLRVRNRIRIEINGEEHHLGLVELTETTAKVNVSSNPQEATLVIGASEKFDVDEDFVYDLLVTLNSIESNKANITILSISEALTTEEIDKIKQEEESDTTNLLWLWILIIIIALIALFYFKKKKKK